MENVLLLALSFSAYFLPNIIAYFRNHRNFNPIFIINLFFGWTVIGWIVCLAWSLSSNVEPTTPKTVMRCTRCAEIVNKDARICKHCGARFD